MPFQNPFRPGAGHMPPYLAGRDHERDEFQKLLGQLPILKNLILTGLRGVGKTVLLNSFKPLAVDAGWIWIGTDLSEAATLSEENLSTRLITDLAVTTSGWEIENTRVNTVGFVDANAKSTVTLNFQTLKNLYDTAPGLISDKLRAVFKMVSDHLPSQNRRGIVFAYDEAQILADHPQKDEYPLSLLLDVFQFVQRGNVPFILILTGLPTLFHRLNEARTYSERMFTVLTLERLSQTESRDAILKPIEDTNCPVRFNDDSVQLVIEASGGYPYFIQFICREVYDLFIQQIDAGGLASVPIAEITRKLDNDFFVARWERATDRQRELMMVIAMLDTSSEEFTTQEISQKSKELLSKPLSPSHVNQMLAALSELGLVYRARHGKYMLAVPLLDDFVRRQYI